MAGVRERKRKSANFTLNDTEGEWGSVKIKMSTDAFQNGERPREYFFSLQRKSHEKKNERMEDNSTTK